MFICLPDSLSQPWLRITDYACEFQPRILARLQHLLQNSDPPRLVRVAQSHREGNFGMTNTFSVQSKCS